MIKSSKNVAVSMSIK